MSEFYLFYTFRYDLEEYFGPTLNQNFTVV